MIDIRDLRFAQVCAPGQPGDAPTKVAYKSPVLRAYGSVRELTTGGSSANSDGINVTMMA